LLQTAQWVRASQGTGRAVIADRYTSQILSSFGLEWTPLASQGFPVWQLYFDRDAPSTDLLRQLRASDYRYLVVDERMASFLPYLGDYFESVEPERSTPPSREVIDRFAGLPWAIKIYQSDNLSVYRLNYSAMNVHWTPRIGAPVAKSR
jgi:hypothetical protein